MMSHSLRTLLLAVSLILTVKGGGSQEADKFDTMYTRSRGEILIPVYDTVKQLEKANAKADTIMNNLKFIISQLRITDTAKPKK